MSLWNRLASHRDRSRNRDNFDRPLPLSLCLPPVAPHQAVENATKKQMAVKVINKGKFLSMGGSSEQMMTEVRVLDKLRHPNIIEICNVFETPQFLVIMLELLVNRGALLRPGSPHAHTHARGPLLW